MMAKGSVKSLLRQTSITKAVSGSTKGSIFFLHGTCDSGQGLKRWINQVLHQDFKFKSYRVLYPSSPIRPYKLMNDQNAAVWYDRLSLGPELPEDPISINRIAEEVNKLIEKEQEILGQHKSKVIVGGFSMGGSLALHLGYRFNRDLAGIFALSSFLPSDSSVFESLDVFTRDNPQFDPEEARRRVTSDDGHILDKPKPKISKHKLPKLFMTTGGKDPIVKSSWCHSTFNKIRSYGTEGHFHTIPKQSHEITKPQLSLLHNWIEQVLSDDPKPKIQETKPYHINDGMTVPFPYGWRPK